MNAKTVKLALLRELVEALELLNHNRVRTTLFASSLTAGGLED